MADFRGQFFHWLNGIILANLFTLLMKKYYASVRNTNRILGNCATMKSYDFTVCVYLYFSQLFLVCNFQSYF